MAKKVVLISGGTDGLGKSLAVALAKDHAVVAFGLEVDRVQAEFEQLGITALEADVRKLEDIDRIVAQTMTEHGRIDVLVNSAGVLYHGLLEDHSVESIRDTFETNTLGTILLTRAVLPHMKKAHSGRIMNIVSRGGLYGLNERSVYTASKWAIRGFNESLKGETDKCGVSITAVYPGRMKTNIFAKHNIKTDLSQAIEADEVVRLLVHAIESPNEIAYPELGILRLPISEE